MAGVSDEEQSLIRGQSIGFIFQNYGLIPRMNILKQVMLPLAYQGCSFSERKQRATEALQKVGLSDHLHKNPDALS
jgi:putative ABC transport system ATP-binding protein